MCLYDSYSLFFQSLHLIGFFPSKYSTTNSVVWISIHFIEYILKGATHSKCWWTDRKHCLPLTLMLHRPMLFVARCKWVQTMACYSRRTTENKHGTMGLICFTQTHMELLRRRFGQHMCDKSSWTAPNCCCCCHCHHRRLRRRRHHKNTKEWR